MLKTYSDILREYEKIRLDNIFKYDERRDAIYSKNPILKEYDSKLAELRLNILKAKLSGLDISSIEAEIAKTKTERVKYLKEHDIANDYLNTIYTCKKCKDTGYVNGQKCSCFVQKEIEVFDNISHFKKYIERDNFDNLNMSFYKQRNMNTEGSSYIDYMTKVIDNLKLGIKNMDKDPYNAMLIGPTGTGKTFLARCVGALAIDNNKSVLYTNVNEYLNSTKPDYDGESLKQYAIDCDLFILDDLGTEKITEYTNSEINYIIDKRLNDRKSTIVTTNYTLEQIKNLYLISTYSRLANEYISCYLAGEDLRRIKNANV